MKLEDIQVELEIDQRGFPHIKITAPTHNPRISFNGDNLVAHVGGHPIPIRNIGSGGVSPGDFVVTAQGRAATLMEWGGNGFDGVGAGGSGGSAGGHGASGNGGSLTITTPENTHTIQGRIGGLDFEIKT